MKDDEEEEERERNKKTTKRFSCDRSVGQTSTKFKIQTYNKICIHMF